GLRGGQVISLDDTHSQGLLVKPEVARKQIDSETAEPPIPPIGPLGDPPIGPPGDPPVEPPGTSKPRRFHGAAVLDATRVGRDAGKIAEEVIAHLVGLVGATVTVTIEIDAEIPDGAPDNVVRTVTENSRTLKFTSQGFESE
ncbi:AAA+ family ATPase, partial [Gammaproteobacteria bacterium]|nr:AAA+ family ATPase [Gammaproteobacteria bacterium]